MSTTETKVKHSALPWRFDGSVTIDADGKAVLSVPASHDLRTVNREFMLRAVNSHADMLEALEATLPYLPTRHKHEDGSTNFNSPHHIFVQVQAAIAKARGGAA